MYSSISVFQTEREDVNTVNGICAFLDTAAQMGCWTSLEWSLFLQATRLLHITRILAK